MKYIFLSITLFLTTVFLISCEPEDGNNGTDGINGVDGLDGRDAIDEGQAIIIFDEEITDQEAATLIANHAGRNTHTIIINNTKNLTTVSLPGLNSLLNLQISQNEKLEHINLPELTTIYEELTINGNPLLTSINIINASFVYNLQVRGNQILEEVNFDSLNNVARFFYTGNAPLKELVFPELENCDLFTLLSTDLERINLPMLKKGSLSISNTNIKALFLESESLINLESVFINSNPLLESIEFPSSRSFNLGSLSLLNNENLVDIMFGTLDSLDSFDCQSNSQLEQIDFGNLSMITELNISSNENLQSIIMNELQQLVKCRIRSNNVLTSLSFPKLTTVNDELGITNNSTLNSLSLPVLANQFESGQLPVGSIIIDSNNLQSVDMKNLIGLDELDIDEAQLESVNLEKIKQARYMRIISQAIITELNLASLQAISWLDLRRGLGVSTNVSERLLAKLVSITPPITDSEIRIKTDLSTQGELDVQVLRDNGNTVIITPL